MAAVKAYIATTALFVGGFPMFFEYFFYFYVAALILAYYYAVFFGVLWLVVWEGGGRPVGVPVA